MHLMIFYPGGVSRGVPMGDSESEIFEIMATAATIEEGNGDGKIRRRKRKEAYDGSETE